MPNMFVLPKNEFIISIHKYVVILLAFANFHPILCLKKTDSLTAILCSPVAPFTNMDLL